MLSVALTGNIAAGKSVVADMFRRWGATIIDADQIVREVQAPGQPTLKQIAERFGAELILADGSLDRAALRAKVLSEPRRLLELNGIVHPEVHRRTAALLAQAKARGDRIVISDIPLLFEAANPRDFDVVVLVDAPERLRRDRLLASRSMPVEEADRMIAAQLASAVKRGRSDYVIDNDGDIAALERSAASVWQALLARA